MKNASASSRTRTLNPLIKSQLLCQLSYGGLCDEHRLFAMGDSKRVPKGVKQMCVLVVVHFELLYEPLA